MRTLPSQPTSPASSDALSASAEAALALLGPSTAMAQLWTQIRHLAPHARTVLLTGPANAGQGAVARLLLELSPAPGRPLLELQPADAELELSSGNVLSTLPSDTLLFLPDIDRLSTQAQGGLLRILHQRRSRGLIVVTSCSVDLRALVSLGHFNEELFGLLSAVRIALPSLQRRKEDLPMLLSQMLAMHCEPLQRPVPILSSEFLRAAMEHSWPGNLHELQRVTSFLAAKADAPRELHTRDLQYALEATNTPRPITTQVRMVPLDTVMREHIHAVLRACRGNKLRAAETLGISRSTLYRMLEPPQPGGTFAIAG